MVMNILCPPHIHTSSMLSHILHSVSYLSSLMSPLSHHPFFIKISFLHSYAPRYPQRRFPPCCFYAYISSLLSPLSHSLSSTTSFLLSNSGDSHVAFMQRSSSRAIYLYRLLSVIALCRVVLAVIHACLLASLFHCLLDCIT